MDRQLPDKSSGWMRAELKRFLIVVLFGIAFAYVEAAVVVYLREIFHPDGFTFPLTTFGVSGLWKRLLLIEVGREGATLVLILSGAWLFGRTLRQRFAYFLTIFAVWDIFYYVWLKVFLDWPGSIMDWDILFLMPITWAGPVLAPVLVSVTLFTFALIVLLRSGPARRIEPSLVEWLGFVLAGLVLVIGFCIAGLHVREPDFRSHFYWWVFGLGWISSIALFLRCLLKSKRL